MDVLVKLTVPNYVYRFYEQASSHIAEGSPEDIMSDALCAYAGLLDKDMEKRRQAAIDASSPDNS